MVALLGSGDELLRVIEDSFEADIHVRGNEITISGAPAETALVAELFEELTALLAGARSSRPARWSGSCPCSAASRACARPR
jgi:phosphate starvation-inducible PhoH-like protein